MPNSSRTTRDLLVALVTMEAMRVRSAVNVETFEFIVSVVEKCVNMASVRGISADSAGTRHPIWAR